MFELNEVAGVASPSLRAVFLSQRCRREGYIVIRHVLVTSGEHTVNRSIVFRSLPSQLTVGRQGAATVTVGLISTRIYSFEHRLVLHQHPGSWEWKGPLLQSQCSRMPVHHLLKQTPCFWTPK
jgi:hypothetical protein